eukprot:6996451-Prymnesium_polylepis.1
MRRAPPPAARPRAGRAPPPCVCAWPAQQALPLSALLRQLMPSPPLLLVPPMRRARPPAA